MNIDSQYILPEDRPLYVAFVIKMANRLNKEGYEVTVTLTPTTFELETGAMYVEMDYSRIGQATNGTILLSYTWGYTYDLHLIIIPFTTIRSLLDYAVTQKPPAKINIGITSIGYLWRLPYIDGISRVNSISNTNAVKLARDVGASIQYDETSQAAFFYFGENNENIVWFKDARSIDNTIKLATEYGFHGIGLWNIMSYLDQMLLVINSQYEKENVL